MVETKLSYNPDFVAHPGVSLRDEIEFAGLTQVELAQRTGLSDKHISQIINGESPISPETAIKLERALGTPAIFWNNLQKNYELTCARIASEKRIGKEIGEAKKFKCYRELAELGLVEKSKDWAIKTESLLRFFGVDSLGYVQNTEEFAFLRQTRGKFDQRSLAAWLRCGELAASKIETQVFDEKKIKEIIPDLKKLTATNDSIGEKLQKLCAVGGIAVVYTPYFKNTKVNGSARWIGERAVIQLNTRGAYSDMFWFTFFHELGHILSHGVKEKFLEYQGKTKDEKESEADNFAEKTLIPTEEYENFSKQEKITVASVRKFAQDLGIGPSIVLGRLAHKGIADWSVVSGLRARITIGSDFPQ